MESEFKVIVWSSFVGLPSASGGKTTYPPFEIKRVSFEIDSDWISFRVSASASSLFTTFKDV